MKAFLSHSSKDKSLVDAVAKQLGRQHCVYDKYAFETGEEFVAAIERCLDKSEVFVLFASKAAMESVWVKIELEQAKQRRLRESIRQGLVYLIEDDLTIENLPDWIQRALVRRDRGASSIARDIRLHIDDLLRERRHQYFVGRGDDIARFEELLTPTDGRAPPHLFIVTGLPGIGRRTLIRHTSNNLLDLRKHVEIRLGEGDSINDICAKLADFTMPFNTREDFQELFDEIQKLKPKEALSRSLESLRSLVTGGELPIFVDNGGFLDSEGYIHRPASDLIRSIGPQDTAYAAFVSYRRPQRQPEVDIPNLPLDPLTNADSRRLLQRLFARNEIRIDPADLSDIADYISGYPPSAYFALQQAKDYGVDLVVNHKQRLVEFRSGVFLKHLKELSLKELEGSILQLLATFSPLPIAVVVEAIKKELEVIVEAIVRLIDLSLILVDGEGLYRISDPISDAATSNYGFPGKEVAGRTAKSLDKYLSDNPSKHSYLELNRVQFRAASRANLESLTISATRLANDLIRLTEEYYHSREFEQSVNCGKIAVSERPESLTARGYLIRALIQLERWKEAEGQLDELRRFAPPRDVHFLQGFFQRRRGNTREAIAHFEEARKLGRRGAAIFRELCHCYYLIKDLDNAKKYLEIALESHGDNRYVVDLWAQIATDQGDQHEARRALERLEVIDSRVYFLHRKARIEWKFKNVNAARDAVMEALKLENHPPFAVIAQAALCEMTLGNYLGAEEFVVRLDTEYGGIRRDIRIGLRCRLEIARGKFREALKSTERFTDKESRHFKAIRLEAIHGLLMAEDLPEKERAVLAKEEEQLGEEVDSEFWLDPSELDSFRLDMGLF